MVKVAKTRKPAERKFAVTMPLDFSDLGCINDRSLAELLAGESNGYWRTLWRRIEAELSDHCGAANPRGLCAVGFSVLECAAIAQRAVVEKLMGTINGPWQSLWRKIECEVEREERLAR